MDKKQIDYAKLNQERIITIADLIRAIIRKLWVVVYNRYESEAG